MQEWYIISIETGEVVDCLMTALVVPANPDSTKYYLTNSPSQVQLEGYRYYWERP